MDATENIFRTTVRLASDAVQFDLARLGDDAKRLTVRVFPAEPAESEQPVDEVVITVLPEHAAAFRRAVEQVLAFLTT